MKEVILVKTSFMLSHQVPGGFPTLPLFRQVQDEGRVGRELDPSRQLPGLLYRKGDLAEDLQPLAKDTVQAAHLCLISFAANTAYILIKFILLS